MKYKNTRNSRIASLVSEDSKFKTVLLEYEDGSTVSVSQSTFKRWWKKVAEPVEVQAEEPVVAEPVVEAPVQDVKEVDVVPVKTVKKASKDKKPVKAISGTSKNADKNNAFEQLVTFVKGNECVTESREWIKYSLAIKVNGKPFLEVRTLRNGNYTVYGKEDTISKLGKEFNRVTNYYLPAVLKNASLEEIKNLF